MKSKCDKCDRPATHHAIEIVGGKKIEKNLCDTHAAEDGLAVKAAHAPINELLTNFVKLHSGGDVTTGSGGNDAACSHCGTTFGQFREHSLLGCPTCYADFERQISPLLERAHEGATHHVGKMPHLGGAGDQRQIQLMRMRKRLDDAVATEDYELAARLRDEIGQLEAGHA